MGIFCVCNCTIVPKLHIVPFFCMWGHELRKQWIYFFIKYTWKHFILWPNSHVKSPPCYARWYNLKTSSTDHGNHSHSWAIPLRYPKNISSYQPSPKPQFCSFQSYDSTSLLKNQLLYYTNMNSIYNTHHIGLDTNMNSKYTTHHIRHTNVNSIYNNHHKNEFHL